MIDKFLKYFPWVLRICFAVVIVYSVVIGDMKLLTDSLAGFALTFVAPVLQKLAKIRIPIRLEAFFVLFIFLANFLGSCLNFYDLIPIWDIVLHTSSGAFLAILSLSFIDCAVKGKSIRDWNPYILALLMLTFAMACGTLWEFFEYTIDTLFDYGMQKHTLLPDGTMDTGLIDTMGDELCAAASALVYTISALICSLKGKYEAMEQFLIKKAK